MQWQWYGNISTGGEQQLKEPHSGRTGFKEDAGYKSAEYDQTDMENKLQNK